MSMSQHKKSSVSRRTAVQLIGGGLGSLAAPAIVRAQGARPKEISVGALCSLSGPAAAFGVAGRNAFEIRTEEINKAGGLWGDGNGMIKLVVADDQSKPDVAVSEVGRLAGIRDLVAVTVLAPSASTLQGTVEGERRRLPIINTGGAANEINTRGLKYTFSTCSNWTSILRSYLEFCAQAVAMGKAEPKKPAFIYENKFAGPSARKAMSDVYGATVKWPAWGDYPYDPATVDFGPMVSKLKAEGVDFAMVYSYPQDAALLIKTMREQSFNPLAIAGATGATANAEFAQALGSASDYVMGQSPYLFGLGTPGNAEFVAAYRARTGKAPDNVAGQAYNGMSALAAAMRRAKNPADRDSVREAMAVLKVEGGKENIIIPGGIAIDDTGSNPATQGAFFQIRNGTHAVVLPQQFATAQLVYPRPTWDKYAN
jgi:branched-chain amino acid transport system substrate-binding protein